MRRLIAVLMLALLPFQFSWSAVAAYCMHESSTSQSQHLGHHEHQHEAKGGNGQAEKSSQGADAFDVDCSVCHGAGIGGGISLFFFSLVRHRGGSSCVCCS